MSPNKQMDEEYRKASEYLDSVDVNSAEVVLCELIDEKSHVWNFNKHAHDHTEFLYILDGNMQIDVPGRTLMKRIYNLVVYPKNVSHQEILDLHEHQQVICIGIATSEPCKLKTALEIDDADGHFRWILTQIYEEQQNMQPGYEAVVHHYIGVLYALMQRYYKSHSARQHDFVSKCICYIHDHILENITIEQLSAVSYVSPSHLTRTFRQRTGYSPLAYIRNCRLNIARRELIFTRDNIEEIAMRAGFHDPKYFSRFFKAETGMTPREFRAKNKADVNPLPEEE